jgi:hypothetical protein
MEKLMNRKTNSKVKDAETRKAEAREYRRHMAQAKKISAAHRREVKREWQCKYNRTPEGKAFQHDYYLRVTKPKRAKERAARIAAGIVPKERKKQIDPKKKGLLIPVWKRKVRGDLQSSDGTATT